MPRQVVQDGRLYAYALKSPMDIMTGVGLVSGILVIAVMVLMGAVWKRSRPTSPSSPGASATSPTAAIWNEATPLRVSIVGHTAASFVPSRSEYGAFDLSADRANVVRQILEHEGVPSSHIFAVSGKADSQQLFPDDPSLPANRRVTITLMREDPPLPPDMKP